MLAAALVLVLLFEGPMWLVRLYGSGATGERSRVVSCASNLKGLSMACDTLFAQPEGETLAQLTSVLRNFANAQFREELITL